MIVTSTYTEGPAQVDGRRYVSELHTDDRGQTYTFEWLGDQDAGLVLPDRAAVLSAQIAAQRAAGGRKKEYEVMVKVKET